MSLKGHIQIHVAHVGSAELGVHAQERIELSEFLRGRFTFTASADEFEAGVV
jgi:hypothetical protein